MPTMINRGKELIRVCPNNTAKLEYSMNSGRICYLFFDYYMQISRLRQLLYNPLEKLNMH